jgi:hypothetical protein
MGLPHDYNIDSFKKNSTQIISQNVPVNTAIDMTNFVKDFINNDISTINAQFALIDNTIKDNRLRIIEKPNIKLF